MYFLPLIEDVTTINLYFCKTYLFSFYKTFLYNGLNLKCIYSLHQIPERQKIEGSNVYIKSKYKDICTESRKYNFNIFTNKLRRIFKCLN